MTPFAVATAVTHLDDGVYRSMLDESWNLRPLPQGGIVTAAALRAMEDTLGDPSQRLRTVHTACRRGRSSSTASPSRRSGTTSTKRRGSTTGHGSIPTPS